MPHSWAVDDTVNDVGNDVGNNTARIVVGNFSKAALENTFPPEWEPLTFPGVETHTDYQLVNLDGTVVIKAESKMSASGLIRQVNIDPKQYPRFKWRWRAENIINKSNVLSKEGDDYPVRIYITFDYDADRLSFSEGIKYELYHMIYGTYPPLAAINYIWAKQSPVGAVVPNAYTAHVSMIVAESGPYRIGRWLEMERNVYEDYKKAFGEEPGMITGVAIMTDTDNTGESATAYYGDLVFLKPKLDAQASSVGSQ